MLLGRTLDQTEQRRGHRLAVDDELTVEYLVAAVLRVDLREAEHLAVGQLAPDAAADAFQIGDFLVAQGQSLLPVVRRHVVDVDDRIGLLADREDLLVDRAVLALQHRVERDVFAFRLDELLDAADAGGITLSYEEKQAIEGKKRKQLVKVVKRYAFSEVKYTKEYLDFK